MGTRTLRTALLVCILALALTPAIARADDAPFVYQGGDPGVRIVAANVSIEQAATPASAIRVDPDVPLSISMSLSPPSNTSWEVRAIEVGLLVNGPGSTPPDLLSRTTTTNSSLPPGWTVVINRTVDLAAMKRVGAGTFLMAAKVRDDHDATLFDRAFYVHVPVSAATLLTVQGAAITAVSVATGYGFWQVAKDAKEIRDAWDRHRRKRETAKLDLVGHAQDAAEAVIERAGRIGALAIAMNRDMGETEHRLGLVRWSATGLGLGGVAIAWAQFLGYIALNATRLLSTALEGAALFLTLALVANALLKRARTRRVPVQESATAAPVQEPVAEEQH